VRVAFSDCELDVGRHELRRAGQVVAVEPQVMDVLAYLARHSDRLVTKSELLDEVWGDRFVSESALTSRIKSARRAVGDTGRDQRIIRTIHGRGYRFVAPVVDATTREAAITGSAVATPSAEGRAPFRTIPAGAAGATGDVEPATDDRVTELVRALGAGHGHLLGIEGPYASRKTALIDQAVDLAAASGCLVGTGSAAGTGGRTFGCVLDAVDELVQREEALVDRLPPGAREELERWWCRPRRSARP
jgi:DNA-binding winged helix-turn-helix (wHTH) protein